MADTGQRQTSPWPAAMSALGRLCCKTIFATEMRNIDSRMRRSTQQRFKTAVSRIRLLRVHSAVKSFATQSANSHTHALLPAETLPASSLGGGVCHLACAIQEEVHHRAEGSVIGDIVPGYEANGWQGIGAPKNMPAEVVTKLNGEINTALADLADAGYRLSPGLGGRRRDATLTGGFQPSYCG